MIAVTPDRYREVRAASLAFTEGLPVEDLVIQSMTEASPLKWHLAHTTWFFETFVLSRHVEEYEAFHPRFEYLFNSYYYSVGEQFHRPSRGVLSRPTVEEIRRYRSHVDRAMADLLRDRGAERELAFLVEVGLNHEQQHQELMHTDVKHGLSRNPLRPAIRDVDRGAPVGRESVQWHEFPEGLREVGHDGETFAWDNEFPRHRVHLGEYSIASRPVTAGEYMEFIRDDGYRDPELWLSDGWFAVRENRWEAPLYWERAGDAWTTYSLAGPREVDPDEPVCHVSFFEADAFARWTGARLPTEQEWEAAAPLAAAGQVWEWTRSPYEPYPGYRPWKGGLGEYNGKFMCNQYVLRGGSRASPPGHIRATYRNFFPPEARWQVSGFRLARNAR